MRILLAGATGALGRRLLPKLLEAGHYVVGTTRSADKIEALQSAGARGVVMNGLDERSVNAALQESQPDVVIHQMTALGAMTGNLRRLDGEFAETNRLRMAGTDHLLAAAQAVGARRFIAQSYTGWPNARSGARIKDERDPLDPTPCKGCSQTLEAIRYLEEVVPAAGIVGLVLRYGAFYGPGTGLGKGGNMASMVTRRRLPVVGSGAGMFSFCHIDDATSATVAALTQGTAGLYNIVDDDPAAVAEWVPYLARLLGAKPPLRVPVWLAKPLIGEFGVAVMTEARASSNAKAKAELGWSPGHPSWREGFRTEFS